MNVISGKRSENSWKRELISPNLISHQSVCAQIHFHPQTNPQQNRPIMSQKWKNNQKERIKTLK